MTTSERMTCLVDRDVCDAQLGMHGRMSSSVAILELKKWGDHCGTKEKVGGPT